MMRIDRALPVAVLLLLSSGAVPDARAQGPTGASTGTSTGTSTGAPADPFAGMDPDGDGRVTREEVAAFRAARFDVLDANHDGKLQPTERGAVRPNGARPGDAAFRRLDTDGDGRITGEEMERARKGAARRAVDTKGLFDRADANHDGNVDRAEWEAARSAPQPAGADGIARDAYVSEADNWIRRFDTNRDGALTRNELRAAAGKWRNRSSN